MILDSIEKSIKEKVEALGTPLSEWDIRINYGIKTGFNEAFIISGAKKDELIAKDPKSAEIIRPILRGRDIKRYGYEFADLHIINSHNGIPAKGIDRIDINNYPAIKRHLDIFGDRIYDRFDQGDTPYNLRSCAYLEDFNKQKIIYPNMTKYLPFYLDNDSFMTNQKCFILTGKHLSYLCAFLNSRLFFNVYRDNFPELLGGTRELSKIFFERVRVIDVDDQTEIYFKVMVDEIQKKQARKEDSKAVEDEINNVLFLIYKFTDKEIRYVWK